MTGIVIAVMFMAATARLYVFPAQGMPAHVDAVAMLDGPNSGRLATALRLAREHRALLVQRSC